MRLSLCDCLLASASLPTSRRLPAGGLLTDCHCLLTGTVCFRPGHRRPCRRHGDFKCASMRSATCTARCSRSCRFLIHRITPRCASKRVLSLPLTVLLPLLHLLLFPLLPWLLFPILIFVKPKLSITPIKAWPRLRARLPLPRACSCLLVVAPVPPLPCRCVAEHARRACDDHLRAHEPRASIDEGACATRRARSTGAQRVYDLGLWDAV